MKFVNKNEKVKAGVRLEMNKGMKVGPEIKNPNKMKKEEFEKILEERRIDKKKMQRQLTMKKIMEESADEEQKRREGKETALLRELQRLSEMSHVITIMFGIVNNVIIIACRN